MTLGVFILKSGQWSLWATYTNRASANQEIQYLTKSLGLTAKLFQKVA